MNNWQVDGLNNFRQNTQGTLGKLNIADLTVELADLENLCERKPPSPPILKTRPSGG